jgi:hypothetical protein
MEVETVTFSEPKAISLQISEETKCIFYKAEACTPTKMRFNICAKCHRCRVVTMENLVPRMFEKIVGLAIMLMNINQKK